jgi:hypothetical protein
VSHETASDSNHGDGRLTEQEEQVRALPHLGCVTRLPCSLHTENTNTGGRVFHVTAQTTGSITIRFDTESHYFLPFQYRS